MAPHDWQAYLTRELGPINQALTDALKSLPPSCRPVAAHILDAGGKRMRPCLVLLAARLFGSATPDIYRLAASMEMLHAATLLHDDILDNAASRRSQPAAHTVFGITRTILAGDALLALGNALVAEFGLPRLTACYSQATMQTASGEIMEMECLRRPELTASEYLEIARGKTACLFAQACAMGAILAGAPPSGTRTILAYGENLGLAFQVVDDALDFSPQAETGKPSGGDLREGKMTPPIRLYRDQLSPDAGRQFDQDFRNGSFTAAQIAELAARIRPYARESLKIADVHLERAKAALMTLPHAPERDILLAITDYTRNRHS